MYKLWWRHQMETFPRNWPFVRGIHRGPVNSPHKGQWRGALMFSLICVWINSWVNNRETGDLRCHRAHYDVSVMVTHYRISVRFHGSLVTFILSLIFIDVPFKPELEETHMGNQPNFMKTYKCILLKLGRHDWINYQDNIECWINFDIDEAWYYILQLE